MNPQLLADVSRRLEADFSFKTKGKNLQQGRCPECDKKELYAFADAPWVLRCGRLNKCGAEFHIKDLYNDLFNNWTERVAPTPTNPNATADAYLSEGRGFDLSLIKGCYSQETFHCHKRNISSATVRFELTGGAMWERIIDKPHRFGKQKANFRGSYKGDWWQHPKLDLNGPDVKKLWLVEGIFDAIAHVQVGNAAVSLMSCNNYPEKALAKLKAERKGELPELVFALDDGVAGSRFIKKFVARARDEGWICRAAQIKSKGRKSHDWNDLLQLDKLNKESIDDALYNGALLIAKSANDKAMLMYNKHPERKSFFFRFSNRMYWFALDIDKFQSEMEKMSKQFGGEIGEETLAKLDDEAKAKSESDMRDMALESSRSIYTIANCYPQVLYFQQNLQTDESWYYCRVDFPHDGGSIKNTLTGAQLSSAGDFKKRLISMAPGALYSGNQGHLDRIVEDQTYNVKVVQTVDFIGYSKELSTWVFNQVAVHKGSTIGINDEDYFDVGKVSVKSLNQSVTLQINEDLNDYSNAWLALLWKSYHAKGIVALAYWLGSLFAEQIREHHKSFPFLEIVGDAGAGKSTLIEFLWKLVGRADYEGFDPSKSTLAARARNFAQVAGLPIVLIESDRGGEDKAHAKSFDWDELKTAFNGRSVRSRGVKNGGNETFEPPFRGSVVISQNATVSGSPAMMQRIVHVHMTVERHSKEGKLAGEQLERMPVEDVSGFVLKATNAEAKIMERFIAQSKHYEQVLSENRTLKTIRIIKNHAQLLALIECLPLAINIEQTMLDHAIDEVADMAEQRQIAINADHPDLITFWETYEYLNGDPENARINHSTDKSLIAINLNHFLQRAAEKRQQVAPLPELKKLLKTSRTHKFLEVKTVSSAVNSRYNASLNFGDSPLPKSVKCWVFDSKLGS